VEERVIHQLTKQTTTVMQATTSSSFLRTSSVISNVNILSLRHSSSASKKKKKTFTIYALLTSDIFSLSHPFLLKKQILKQTSAGLSTGARSVEATTLPNGIKVVSVNTGSPITTFSVSVRAGSRHESSNARGVSHIVRNLAFLV